MLSPDADVPAPAPAWQAHNAGGARWATGKRGTASTSARTRDMPSKKINSNKRTTCKEQPNMLHTFTCYNAKELAGSASARPPSKQRLCTSYSIWHTCSHQPTPPLLSKASPVPPAPPAAGAASAKQHKQKKQLHQS
jgi:hypothetical protein